MKDRILILTGAGLDRLSSDK